MDLKEILSIADEYRWLTKNENHATEMCNACQKIIDKLNNDKVVGGTINFDRTSPIVLLEGIYEDEDDCEETLNIIQKHLLEGYEEVLKLWITRGNKLEEQLNRLKESYN